MDSPFLLTNEHIIVTGASSGIGRQCAIAFSRLGANLTLLGKSEERLNDTLSQLERKKEHQFFCLDLLKSEEMETVVELSVKKLGKVHGLVNSAGIATTIPLRSVTNAKMEDFFSVNVFGAINLTRIVTKRYFMSPNKGSIIFIASIIGVVGDSGKSLYGMTKGALISGVRSLSIELAARNIRVNAVSPGVVVTPMLSNASYSKDQMAFEKIKNAHPLGLGAPEDVANSCAFLLSDASRWITGSNLIIDGGYSAV
ncbi:MAG: SDR family NAD(P)-dependent oxidoreductase [Imperialibacter sp.]|uniref:SDR family NAD(P)-dependent oxidoreductase n=1 Tax=unclassified Imperialibacter TaxID=2629706 RepID=UPI001251E451|nr:MULTISPECIES: SDR family oxidoreductase [unclassified Imperialibacter]CAD5253138.1 Short-chain dehydrogenase [Imperialibacter sp. 89]CAD5261343.1 Short-chain dehydrogenase [Imperialibacter sp. 75]VVT03406.1 NAD(P)-dependent dehydrogenase, short-chain alcohol dehydrogenase family [Imperialibacter sp. EC-SDR9]|tara:strand:- start:1682 stop:2446 length:765 start_codon:yes stop_codon:yes gene_type:complete